MSETKLQSVVLMQPQEKNINGKIFGGYLMRKAYELAWSCAYTFAKVRPFFVASDTISFNRSVDIGSISIFNSEVIYNEDHTMIVCVTTEVVEPDTGDRARTNSYYFTFICPETKLPKIYPESYDETMSWLEGKRKVNHGKEVAISMDSNLLRFIN